MKKFLTRLTLMSSLVLAACSSGAEEGSDNTADNGGTGTLSFLLSEEPSETNALNNAIHKWAEETGNEVETLVIPYDDQLTKFPLMVKNNDVPDLVATTRLTRLFPEEFTDLSEEIDTSIFDETALKIISQNYTSDAVYAAPNQYTVTNYYYNKDAFEAAGIEAPTLENPWTLDELYDNAAKLKESGNVKYGLAVDFSRARYDNLMYSNGGSMTEKEGDEFVVTINSDENIQTLEKFVELNNSDVMPKVIWSGGSSDNPADYFQNGDVGILLSGSWNYEKFNNEISSFDFAVMPSPIGSLQASTITGGSGLAVPSTAANKDLAIDFLEWLYEEENYLEYLAADKGISFITEFVYEDEDPDVAADYAILKAEMANVADEFLIDEQSEWRNHLDNEYRDYLRQAVSGELSAQEALDGFAKDLSEKSGWTIKE